MIVGEIQSQSGSIGHSGRSRIGRNRSEDGEMKEMIIGVGNGPFVWVYVCGIESELSELSDATVSIPICGRRS